MGDRIERQGGMQSPEAGAVGGAEVSTTDDPALARIFQSLTHFSVLTRILRAKLDPALAAHVTVSGWKGGVLRVTLGRPALATRWRFEAPSVKARLATVPELEGLRDIRLVMVMDGWGGPQKDQSSRLPAIAAAPREALESLAEGESHPGLREAFRRLAESAAHAQRERP